MPTDRLTGAEYLKQARRLRGRYFNRPDELHRRLRELSTGRNTDPGSATAKLSSPRHDFAELVIAHIQGGVLRYSDRERLFEIARRMGIGRFETNLLIAVAEHRCGRSVSMSSTKKSAQWPAWVLALALQALIIAGVCWLLF